MEKGRRAWELRADRVLHPYWFVEICPCFPEQLNHLCVPVDHSHMEWSVACGVISEKQRFRRPLGNTFRKHLRQMRILKGNGRIHI